MKLIRLTSLYLINIFIIVAQPREHCSSLFILLWHKTMDFIQQNNVKAETVHHLWKKKKKNYKKNIETAWSQGQESAECERDRERKITTSLHPQQALTLLLMLLEGDSLNPKNSLWGPSQLIVPGKAKNTIGLLLHSASNCTSKK